MYDSVFEVISCKGRSGGKMEKKRITFAPNFCNLLKQNPKLYVVTGEEIFHFLFKQHKTHGSRASMIFVFQSIHVFSLAPCNSYIDLIGCCD